METSVGSTIEKIKLQEQDKEAKLKEKREFDASITTLNRTIRETIFQTEKCLENQKELSKSTDTLRTQFIVQTIHRDALLAQAKSLSEELEDLRHKSKEGISKVWELRSLLCEKIHTASNNCDVWALLIKPICAEPLTKTPTIVKQNTIIPNLTNDHKLKAALEKRFKVLAERDRLLTEPDTVEEFIRNLLKYNKQFRMFSTEVKENEPIKFSTSDAARRKIPPVFKNPHRESMPWYQPYSVVGSVAVFLIYFCILREENDVDQEFNKTLYDRIKGLEKEQLLQSYKYNMENGKSVVDIERRLKELEIEEANAAV